MSEKIAAIVKARDEYRDMVKRLGKEAVAESLKALFEAHPELVGVRWAQYTPYFNDGEPCEFGVRELYYRTANTAEDAGDYEDGYESTPWRKEDKTPLHLAVDEFDRSRDEDIMREAFGDHVQVTATREGVEVEEYEHD